MEGLQGVGQAEDRDKERAQKKGDWEAQEVSDLGTGQWCSPSGGSERSDNESVFQNG
jgi:hypothetical protein